MRLFFPTGQALVNRKRFMGRHRYKHEILITRTFIRKGRKMKKKNGIRRLSLAAVFMAVICFSGLAFGADVIIDNGDPGTTPTGTWLTSSGANPFGGSSLYSNEIGAFYTYEASVNGIQQVSLWWTFWSNRCTSIDVSIRDGTTAVDLVTVNQQANGGQWNVLGTYTFSGTASVIINSLGVGGCTTSADAVKFSLLPISPRAAENLHSWSQILPAAERFELVMGGAGVLDKETALVWEQSPAGFMTWFTALSHCFTKKTDGRGGWRMPTIEELHSLVDPTQNDPPLPSGHLFSTNVQSSGYWSSTTNPSGILNPEARTVIFSSGFVFSNSKANNGFVWCVRGGQGYDAY